MQPRIYRGQRYVAAAVVPHKRRDGRETKLVEWTSSCTECGEPFSFRAALHASKLEPNRRCRQHAKPGVPARRD